MLVAGWAMDMVLLVQWWVLVNQSKPPPRCSIGIIEGAGEVLKVVEVVVMIVV